MKRTFAGCLIVALTISFVQTSFAQQGETTIATPATPAQLPAEGVKPDSPAGRKAGKAKIVLPLPKEYEARDKNGDGQIGLYEWDRSKYAEFFKLDKNGDGFLTAQELTPKGTSAGARLKVGGGTEKEPLPNPGTLVTYNQKIGETISFTVTGQTKGSLWGTGNYTTDSDLPTVAVHAGILKDGETGVVRVTIIESPAEFAESTANGITSGSRGVAAAAAFMVR